MPDGANMFPTPEAQPPKQDSSCLPLRPNIVAFSRHFSLAQGDVAGAAEGAAEGAASAACGDAAGAASGRASLADPNTGERAMHNYLARIHTT